jgi:hypothetical protein
MGRLLFLRERHGNVATITPTNATMAAGNTSESASAVRGARPRAARNNAGAAVRANSATIAKPAALSRPLVAASDNEPKVTDAAKRNASVSSDAMMKVARRSGWPLLQEPEQVFGPPQNL